MDTVDDMTELESLPVEQLVELIREKTGAGVNLSFPGKVLARQLGRRVRPRTMRTVKAHSAGTKVLCVDTKASFIIEPEARRKLLVDLNLPITRGDSLQPVPHLGLVHITRVLLRRRAHRLTQHHRHPAATQDVYLKQRPIRDPRNSICSPTVLLAIGNQICRELSSH